MDSLTILRTLTPRNPLAKTYALGAGAGGAVRMVPYSGAERFRVELAEVSGIHDVLTVLRRIERDKTACVIRGEPMEDTSLADTDRKNIRFAEVPRRWLMLDLDHLHLPPGTSIIDGPAEAARWVLDRLAECAPELEGVAAVVQFTSSAGLREMAEAEAAAGLPPRWNPVLPNGFGAHVWFWLAEPVDGARAKRWAEAVSARAGGKLIDTRPFQRVQVHYTAAPVFEPPLRDPLAGRRTVFLEGEEAATLIIPDAAPAHGPSGAGRGGFGGGRGYLGCLDAIGGPHGFQGPILSAVASHAAGGRAGDADLDRLHAEIAERVLAADPGGRSPDTIKRYASREFVADKLHWVLAQEAEKRAREAEAARVAPPVPPTHPGPGLSEAVAAGEAHRALGRFVAAIAEGYAPQLLLRMTVGTGKTRLAVAALPKTLQAGRWMRCGPVLWAHPRHKLGDQTAADIRAAHPALRVAVWRGMDAGNPDRPGEKMCEDRALTRAAEKAGLPARVACGFCPLARGCAYLAQLGQTDADVWVAPHQILFLEPFGPWPRESRNGFPVPLPPSAVIVDEDMTSAGLRGMDAPLRLALSALASEETGGLKPERAARLLELRRAVLAVLEAMPAGGVQREPLARVGFHMAPALLGAPGKPALLEWSELEWDARPRVEAPEGAGRDEALAAFRDAAGSGFTPLRPALAVRLWRFLQGGDARAVNLTIEPEADLGNGQGTGPAVRFAWREDFHQAWAEAPMLFLDATGEAEALRHWAPGLEVADIEVRAPFQHVVQVADREFGRTMLMQPHNADRLADLALAELAAAGGRSVLLVCQQAVEALLPERLEGRGGVPARPGAWRFPSGAVLHLAHHGAVTGSNEWQDVAAVIVAGRPAQNREDGERLAEVIAGRAVERVAVAEDSWWPTTTAALRMEGGHGIGRRMEGQPRHPDPLVEAVRRSVTEGSVMQAIGRGRGVRRTAANPLRVVVLARLALPLEVAEAKTWEDMQPSRLEVAAAEAALNGRALPLAAAGLATARPDLWPSVKAAEWDLKRGGVSPQTLIRGTNKGMGGNPPLASARYRRHAAGGRWSDALVPPIGGRAALEALLGPLAAFEPVAPPVPAQAPAAVPPRAVPPAITGTGAVAVGPPAVAGAASVS